MPIAELTSADQSKAKLKSAALALFSKRGIDGVSVRDIVAASGLRNGASLHYHFGSKEGLVKTLLVETTLRSDETRRVALEDLESKGGPHSVREVVQLLVDVETGRFATRQAPQSAGFGHMRLIAAMQVNHRHLLREALEDHMDIAYVRCLDHIRRMLSHLPVDVLGDRLVFMYLLMTSALAARENDFDADAEGGRMWSSPDAISNLIDAITSVLEAPFQSA